MSIRPTKKLAEELLNLHDVFLNTTLLKKQMDISPLVKEPDQFHISHRGRFERLWVAFLYVFYESWSSGQMKEVRRFLLSLDESAELTSLLREYRRDGTLQKMKSVRDYMFHRDKRNYWDTGRIAVCLQLDKNSRLSASFGKLLLAGFARLMDGKSTQATMTISNKQHRTR